MKATLIAYLRSRAYALGALPLEDAAAHGGRYRVYTNIGIRRRLRLPVLPTVWFLPALVRWRQCLAAHPDSDGQVLANVHA